MISKSKFLIGIIAAIVVLLGFFILDDQQKAKEFRDDDSISEKTSDDKVDSYLALLMNEKGFQQKYNVDIEFSRELSSEDISEIESGYNLKFSRLPDGVVAHTATYYGATIDGYAINQLSNRADIIRITSVEKPVKAPVA